MTAVTAGDQIKRDQIPPFNLLGKDYLTEAEAAHYCGVSYSQFRTKRLANGILAIKFMGKRIYRRADLESSIDRYGIREHWAD